MPNRSKIKLPDGSIGPKPKAPEENEENWLITYADTITNLLAFFILIVSMSQINMNKFEQVSQSVRENMHNVHENVTSLNKIKSNLDSILHNEIEHKDVDVVLDKDGVYLNMLSNNFYNSAEAELLPQGKEIVDRVLGGINLVDNKNFNLDVEGHTDDVPIHNDKYNSNWDLSTTRASNVIHYMIDKGIPPNKLKASGYADTRPLKPNTDAAGNHIAANMAYNRRIVIRIYH